MFLYKKKKFSKKEISGFLNCTLAAPLKDKETLPWELVSAPPLGQWKLLSAPPL
jgi:hypothetical protein